MMLGVLHDLAAIEAIYQTVLLKYGGTKMYETAIDDLYMRAGFYPESVRLRTKPRIVSDSEFFLYQIGQAISGHAFKEYPYPGG